MVAAGQCLCCVSPPEEVCDLSLKFRRQQCNHPQAEEIGANSTNDFPSPPRRPRVRQRRHSVRGRWFLILNALYDALRRVYGGQVRREEPVDRSEYLKAVDRSEVRVVRCAPLAELFKKVPLSHSTRRLTGESTSRALYIIV